MIILISFIRHLITLAAALCLTGVLHSQVQVRLSVVDRFQQEIPGCSIRSGSGTYLNGGVATLAPGLHTFDINLPFNGGLGRTEVATVTAATTELAFEWITSTVRFRIHDQHGTDIAGSTTEISQFGAQRFVPTGDTRVLPITDPSVYPTSYGAFRDGYYCNLSVLVGGNLGRPESGVKVLASTTRSRSNGITAVVRWRVRDQHGTDLHGSAIEISHFGTQRFVQTGDTRVVPITDVATYPTSFGQFRDGYSCDLSVLVGGNLGRPESGVKVLAGTTEIAFEWITSVVRWRLRDQHGVDIPASTIEISHFPGIGSCRAVRRVSCRSPTPVSIRPAMGSSAMATTAISQPRPVVTWAAQSPASGCSRARPRSRSSGSRPRCACEFTTNTEST